MPELVLMTAAIGVTVLSGSLSGGLKWRWGPDPQTLSVAQRLATLPEQIGSWRLRRSHALAPGTVELLQCAEYLNRQYEHQETGDLVHMAVLLGPQGPISVHTPEICFSSRNYSILQSRRPITITDPARANSTFWKLSFESNGVGQEQLDVHYAWTQDGRWTAADSPRFSFVGSPFLLKIQLASFPALESNNKNGPGDIFLRDFVPVFKQHLFATAMVGP